MHINLQFLERLANMAGEMIVDGYVGHGRVILEAKEDTTPVTSTDKAINEFVLRECKKHFPHMSILAEEGSSPMDSEWTIYCDPVDGTIPFVTGVPLSTFCISVVHKGVVKFAIIYEPFTKRMYAAEIGKGAYLNGKPISVSKATNLKGTYGSVLWWKGSTDLSRTCKFLEQSGMKWMNLGTIGIVGGLVGSGCMDVSLFPGKMLWETGAMALIVEEAGGKCTDLAGKKIDFTANGKMCGHVITNGALHDKVLSLISI